MMKGCREKKSWEVSDPASSGFNKQFILHKKTVSPPSVTLVEATHFST